MHIPVLLHEVIDALSPVSGARYIDGTFGGGGHTRAILERSAPDGRVLAFDRDREAILRGEALAALPAFQGRLQLAHASFADLERVATERGFALVNGILLDLGLSSFQMDDGARGFAFSHDGALDMRFDQTTGESALDVVNTWTESEIANALWQFGEEQKSRRIARAIVAEREQNPIETTTQLAALVEQAVGGRRGAPVHPATKTFQALRIAVNDELDALRDVLPQAVRLLAPGGVLAVISFHSLEDRIVKQFFRHEAANCICPPELPVCTCGHLPTLNTPSKAIRPGKEEIVDNPRSRSAVLRVAVRNTNKAAGQ